MRNFSNLLVTKMSKSFVFLLSLMLGVLLAQAVCAASPETKDQSEPKPKQREIREFPRPFLSCMLFQDDSACSVVCSMLGSIYSNPSITWGSCRKNNQCECEVSPETTLDELWKAKFNSNKILKTIRNNQDLSMKILEVLKRPFETPLQTLQNIKPLLTEEQQNQLRVKENPARKLILKTKNGKFNDKAIQKYVAKNLGLYTETFQQLIPYCGEQLRFAFQMYDKDETNCIFCEVFRSQNKFLIKPLTKFIDLWSNSEDRGEIEVLIDPLEKFIKLRPTREYTNNCSDQGKIEKALDVALINEVIKTPLLKVKYSLPATTLQNPAWILKGFDNSQVARHKKGKKCWRADYYCVCVNKIINLTALSWENENPKSSVRIQIHNDGSINQFWLYEGNSVTIDRKTDGEIKRRWKFREYKLDRVGFQITKYPDGREITEDYDGKKIPNQRIYSEAYQETIKMLKQFIDSWCQHNGDLVGRDNCIIY